MSWNDVEEIFRKYDKTNSDGIYLADCVEALREAGLIVEDNEIIEIMDQVVFQVCCTRQFYDPAADVACGASRKNGAFRRCRCCASSTSSSD